MTNKNSVDSRIERMKAMMNYGTISEDKNKPYSGIEYTRKGADGKMYGIVREGTKYYIKISDNSTNILKENFDYIGGFRNRKDNEYNSFANALKNFEMKMMSLKESVSEKSPIVESWDINKKGDLSIEATDKMKQEIARQRQIMGNATMISEKKNYEAQMNESDCCGNCDCERSSKVSKECADTQKNNIKTKSNGSGSAKKQGGDPFTKSVGNEQGKSQKNNSKSEFKAEVQEGTVLGWNNDDEDYLDTSNGTEVGDSAPFTSNAPKKNAELTTEAVDDTDDMDVDSDENELNDADVDGEDNLDAYGDDFDSEDDLDTDADEDVDSEDDDDDFDTDDFDEDDASLYDAEDDDEKNDVDERLDTIEAMMQKIADKLGVDMFEDDELYDDEEADDDDDEYELDADDEDDFDEDDFDDDDDDDFDDDEDDFDDDDEVVESKNYRKLMNKINEDRLNVFGKHPAYRKSPISLPNHRHNEMEGYYDMNDDSAANNAPFGQKIGSSAPFELGHEEITNAIAEAVKRVIKKNR